MLRTETIGCLALGTLLFAMGCSMSDTASGTGGTGSKGPSGGLPTGHGGDSSLSVGSGPDAKSCGSAEPNLEGCPCAPGTAARQCYDGAASQAGKGACVMGSQDCVPIQDN